MSSKDINYKKTFAILIGNILDWFDYSLAGLMAPILGRFIFKNYSFYSQNLFLPLLIFSIGIIFRPLGAIFFGYFGDHYGRRITLMIAILLLVISMFTIAIIPTGKDALHVAAVLYVLFNVLSGFSLGAEFPLAVTLFYELSSKTKRLLHCSLVYCSGLFGMLIGNVDLFFFSRSFSENSQGWRVPFLVAGILGVIGFFYRKKLHESHEFLHMKKIHHTIHRPLSFLFAHSKFSLLFCVFLTFFETVTFNTLLVLSTTFQLSVVGRISSHVVLGNVIFLVVTIFTVLILGKRVEINCVYSYLVKSIAVILLFVFPLYYGVVHSNLAVFLVSTGFFGVLFGSFLVVYPYVLANMFPTAVRCSGILLSYNLMLAIFGGTAPVLILFIYRYTKWMYVPAAYIALAAGLALFFIKYYKKKILLQIQTQR